MTWVPQPGMVLSHKKVKQTVYVVELKETAYGNFWAIRQEYGAAWLIGEANLVDQYEPKEPRVPDRAPEVKA